MSSPSASSEATTLVPTQDEAGNQAEASHIRTHALSAKQERKLIDYIEDTFLDVTRNYKKRTHPSSTLPTLGDYLGAAHVLLSLILQIPPIASSQAALRTAFLLRLTGEALASISGYAPSPEILPNLLTFLSELDSGWCVVLRAQAWDPTSRAGVDVEIPLHSPSFPSTNPNPNPNSNSEAQLDSSFSLLGAPPVSQTDRTRLRSILASGSARLEAWLEDGLRVDGAEDLEQALQRLGLQQAFDDLFVETLAEMGEFAEGMAQVDVPPLLTCM